MLSWLAENLGTVLISAGLIVIVALIIRSIVKNKKAGISSCGAKCGCSGCALAGKCRGGACSDGHRTDVGSLKNN